MHSRLAEWCRSRGLGEFQAIPVLVETKGDGLICYLPAALKDEHTAALGQVLSDLMGVPCSVQAYPWPADPVKRLRRLWRLDGAQFDALMVDDSVAGDGREIRVVFPNAIAESLFQRWGGEARIRQWWPEAPTFAFSVAAAVEVAPAAPVFLPDRDAREDRPRVGQGVPQEEPRPIRDLADSGTATVEGEIFAVNVREGRDKLLHVVLSLTDGVSAIRLRADQRRGQEDFWAGGFTRGQWIRARGNLEVDKFTEEIVLRIRDAGVIEAPPALQDGVGGEGRIELHLHTKMSAMDGLNEVAEAFQLAQSLGHRALAIVDHAVAQAYPEAEIWAEKTGVRAIYGIEVNMLDEVEVLTGPALEGQFSDQTMVVVDVETTGLTPRSHEVIEIGAVKVVRGEIAERFHRMVRPSRTVSKTSYEITGIRPEELADALPEDAVWPEFFEFCRGSVLAAHNARFDMGFLQASYRRYVSHPWPYAVFDSLALARLARPELKSHGLGPLVKAFGVPLSQHHRALADAEATAAVIGKLLPVLEEKAGDEGWLRQPHALAYTLGRPTPVVVLVKDQDGIEPLYRLISQSHLESFHYVPRIAKAELVKHRAHWLLGSPGHGGELQEAYFRGASDETLTALADWYDYWEVIPLDAEHTLLAEENYGDMTTAIESQRALIELGQRCDKPVVAVSDAHYLRPEQKILRDILAETAKGELHQRSANLFYRTTREMLDSFAPLGEETARRVVIDEPKALAEKIGPVSPIPKGLFAPTMPDAEAVVSTLPKEEAVRLYGDPLPAIVAERLDKEVSSIVNNGFSVSYYIAHLLVKKSLRDGYLVGSRGSVGSSLVATLLQITEVNPLPPHYRCSRCQWSDFSNDDGVGSGFDLPDKDCPRCGQPLLGDGHDIAFETFLGFEGDKVPDIDLNFSGEYQSEIHRYTEELFGKGHVFRAGTIATVAAKTAFGLVKAWERETGRTLKPAEVDWFADGLTGVKKTTGQHPGGVMVVPQDQDIHHFCPVQRPADKSDSDVVTTHFDYHAIEGRLVKLDLLGHDDPTAIRLLQELTGIGPDQVPFRDAETLSLFSGVQALGVTPEAIGSPVGSLGIPEFGTSFVRGMLTETHPASFADLVRISGISHGTEVWTNNAQNIIRSGQATLSEVIATRDDIMLYLIHRGLEPKTAFSISESVRKGRGLSPEYERRMREQGVPDWYIESCHKISYLFPKAHAAAYVMMGWRIAWFKVHQPAAYYATYFSVRASDFPDEAALGDIKTVIQAMRLIEEKGNDASPKERGMVTVLEVVREMMARGLRFLPVDLMRSHASRFLIEEDGLRIPFSALSGLGQSLAESIVEARQQSEFLSIADLRERAHVSKPVVELLRRQGALKDLGESSQLTFL